MPKTSIEILNLFKQKLKSLEQIRKKQEVLFLKNQIVRRDIEEVYAGIYLDAVASFEAFIEDLFIGLLAGQFCSSQSDVNMRVKFKSYAVTRDVVLHGRGFFNWFPYDNTERIAKAFFTGGRPFTRFQKDDKDRLERFLAIRHAIAHKSLHAKNMFKRKVLPNLNLTPRDKRPKSFLRSQFSMSPPMNYYQHYIAEILKLASKLC